MGGTFLLGLWAFASSRSSGWRLTHTWLVYALLIAGAIVVIPDSSAGGYYLSTRLQILLYLCCVAAAGDALVRLPRLAAWFAGFSVALALLAVGLAARYITPAARSIALLHDIPVVTARNRPGLLMRPVEAAALPRLNFDAFNWAPVHYLRWHGLLLYNTAWLGEPLIPIRPRASALYLLDGTYFNQAPMVGDLPLANEERARRTLDHVGFVLMQMEGTQPSQEPFAERGYSRTPGRFALGWHCQATANDHWYLCQPTRDQASASFPLCRKAKRSSQGN